MLGWLKRKAQNKFTDMMKDDLERFVGMLRGTSSSEIATLLVTATVIRLNLYEKGEIRDAHFADAILANDLESDTLGLKLNRLIQTFQKMNSMADAAGTMVWLHSVRALQNPEIRYLGRMMWRELYRGFDDIEDAVDGFELMGAKIRPDVHHEARFIPLGLEPEWK